MRVASVIHKVIFALAFAVAVVHFAMVVQAAWEGIAGIDNLETWLRMHTASVSPLKNSNFRSLSEADYRYSETILASTSTLSIWLTGLMPRLRMWRGARTGVPCRASRCCTILSSGYVYEFSLTKASLCASPGPHRGLYTLRRTSGSTFSG